MSFLMQQHETKELHIVHDAVGQRLACHYPNVIVHNLPNRLPYLTDKIQYAIDQTDADIFCRWDDDDISLPWRMDYSAKKLYFGDLASWQPSSYWYCPQGSEREVVAHAANGHVMSAFTRKCLDLIGGYPQQRSGDEDQHFTRRLVAMGVQDPEDIPIKDLFYLYRWGVSAAHLSGSGNLKSQWDAIGRQPVSKGVFVLRPKWLRDYTKAPKN